MRLIDADALLEDIEREYNNHYPTDRDIMDCVRFADTIDPVKHGWWINSYIDGVHHFRCSECAEYIEAVWTANFDYKFCPNCGARMDVD